jgi:hypothetical protein
VRRERQRKTDEEEGGRREEEDGEGGKCRRASRARWRGGGTNFVHIAKWIFGTFSIR